MSETTGTAERQARVAASAAGWNERYAHPKFLFGYRPNDLLVEAEVMLPRHGHVLVLGDGEGRNGVWLASRGHRVTTIDLSEVGVQKARALATERGVEIDAYVGDVVEWLRSHPAAQGPFDAVVSIFFHLPPADRRTVADLVTPRMSPRARLMLEAYTPAQLQLGTGGPSTEENLLTRDRVIADWPGLDLDVRLKERRIFEGMGHQGLSSVVQVLGQLAR